MELGGGGELDPVAGRSEGLDHRRPGPVRGRPHCRSGRTSFQASRGNSVWTQFGLARSNSVRTELTIDRSSSPRTQSERRRLGVRAESGGRRRRPRPSVGQLPDHCQEHPGLGESSATSSSISRFDRWPARFTRASRFCGVRCGPSFGGASKLEGESEEKRSPMASGQLEATPYATTTEGCRGITCAPGRPTSTAWRGGETRALQEARPGGRFMPATSAAPVSEHY